MSDDETTFYRKICIFIRMYKRLWKMTSLRKKSAKNFKKMNTFKGESLLELTYKTLLAKKAMNSKTRTPSKVASVDIMFSDIQFKK